MEIPLQGEEGWREGKRVGNFLLKRWISWEPCWWAGSRTLSASFPRTSNVTALIKSTLSNNLCPATILPNFLLHFLSYLPSAAFPSLTSNHLPGNLAEHGSLLLSPCLYKHHSKKNNFLKLSLNRSLLPVESWGLLLLISYFFSPVLIHDGYSQLQLL